MVLIPLWVGLVLAEKRAERHGVSKDTLSNLVYYSLFGYLLGGRLLYALSNISAFVESPLSVLSLNLDLFDPWAALAVAIIVGFAYGSRHTLPLLSTLDALTPLFAMLAIGVSLSHLAAGTAFGSPTTMPWGMELWGAIRHPSQIYELIASAVIFFLLWFRRTAAPPGSAFLLFAALTAGARLFLEAFRGDSTLVWGGIRIAQVSAWVLLAIALLAHDSTLRSPKTLEPKAPDS
jgi:prolipoprotein diacylglyceryltransferase